MTEVCTYDWMTSMVNGGKREELLMLESKSSMVKLFVLGNSSTADQIVIRWDVVLTFAKQNFHCIIIWDNM
jgi:hypothetical protein